MCSPRHLHAPPRLAARIKASNPIVREALAEFLGTFVLIVFGCGSVAQVELSHHSAGETLTINLAFAFGVVMGAYLSWGISGAHLNPAVSFSMSLIGRFHWWKLPIFCLAQFLGAFTAAATVYGLYHEALMAFNGGNLTVTGPGATAAIFATYPSEHLSIAGGFLDQVLGTALLLLCVMALLDPKNNAVPRGLEPLLVGLVVLVIGLSMGFNAGYAINPARDLGPRVFTAMVGYGSEVFTYVERTAAGGHVPGGDTGQGDTEWGDTRQGDMERGDTRQGNTRQTQSRVAKDMCFVNGFELL